MTHFEMIKNLLFGNDTHFEYSHKRRSVPSGADRSCFLET